MQLLFDGSTESGGREGLGIIPGAVTQFDAAALRLPVPHLGWNTLNVAPGRATAGAEGAGGGLLSGVAPSDRVYFVHSFQLSSVLFFLR